MKIKLAAAAAILTVSTSIGSAADLAVKAPYAAPAPVWSWSGFYIGGHVGAGWGTTETSLASVTPAAGPLIGGIALTQNDRSGFLGGGQIGYDFQSGWAVFGVQGDIAALDVNGTTPCITIGFSCTAKSDWLGTVTGRIGGVVADRALVYVKGGAAWLHTSHSLDLAPGLGPVAFSVTSDTTTLGGLIGMGVEYAFSPNWSAFIEYDYMSFDKKTMALDFTAFANTPAIANVDVKNKLSVAKIGLNYKFGGPIVAKY